MRLILFNSAIHEQLELSQLLSKQTALKLHDV